MKTLEPEFDKSQALMEVLTNLETVIAEWRVEGSKIEEIQRRLDVLRSDWLENKLNDAVQRSVLDISKGIKI